MEKDIEFIGVDGLYGNNNGIQLVQEGILTAAYYIQQVVMRPLN